MDAAQLIAALAVEVERRRHEGAANVFSDRVVHQSVSIAHHLLVKERHGGA
ncbi:hypothetical protein D3C77_812390 [compost metagenome]